MKIELSSTGLRRARAAALRRSLNELAERLTPRDFPQIRIAGLCQAACTPGFTHTQRSQIGRASCRERVYVLV